MTLTDFWDGVRVVNFAILFAAFIIMVYKGVFRLSLDSRTFSWARFLNLCWVVISLYSLGEIMFMSLPGGPRLLLILAISCLQLYVAVFRFKMYEECESE